MLGLDKIFGSGINVAAENAEQIKLELKVEAKDMTWDEAMEELIKLNEGLTEGEKPWRLPTTKELGAMDLPSISSFTDGCFWSSEKTELNQAKEIMVRNGVLKIGIRNSNISHVCFVR